MEKKKNIGGIVLVVILFLTVIGLIGYILVDKDIIKLKKEEKEVSEKKETEENISEEEVEELLDKFGFNIKTYSQNIVFNTGYTDAFKRLVALLKIDTKSIEEKKCSDIFLSQPSYLWPVTPRSSPNWKRASKVSEAIKRNQPPMS